MLGSSGSRALKKPAATLRCLLFPFFSYVAIYCPIQLSSVVWTLTTTFGSILPTIDSWAPRIMKHVARSLPNATDGSFELSSPSNTSLYACDSCQETGTGGRQGCSHLAARRLSPGKPPRCVPRVSPHSEVCQLLFSSICRRALSALCSWPGKGYSACSALHHRESLSRM
jgi:hypothetical protein